MHCINNIFARGIYAIKYSSQKVWKILLVDFTAIKAQIVALRTFIHGPN